MEKLRIFISGTQTDLEVERESVGRAVNEVGLTIGIRAEKVLSMPQSPRAWIQQAVESCDIYVGVFSHRYGWIIPEEAISASEFEFELAHRLGKPILVWVRKLREEERILPNFDRQERFLSRATDFSQGYFRQEFSDVVTLQHWVTDALRETLIALIRNQSNRAGADTGLPSAVLVSTYLRAIADNRPYALWSDKSQYIERGITRMEELFSRTVRRYQDQASQSYDLDDTETLDETLLREEKLVLLGEPGLGKTTSLLHVAWQAANALLTGRRQLGIPIFIELKYYKGEQELEAMLAARVNEVIRSNNLALSLDSAASTTILKAWINVPNSRFLILLDGLNEVKPEYHTVVRDLVQKLFSYPHKFVIACRERDYDLSLQTSAEAFKLQPLQRTEIETYLIGALGEKANPVLYGDIYRDPKMMSLAANPLMLWLISIVAQTRKDARLPANKGRLFQQFVSDMPRLRASEGLGPRIPFDVVVSVLAKLSFEMQERRKLTLALASIRSYQLPNAGFPLEEILAQGKEWRFLKSDGGMGEDLEFLHQLFLEYFAAAHLDSQLRAGQSFSDVIGQRHASEWWGEVITMLAGITDQASELIVWLSDQAILSGQANLVWLAARCLETSAALTDERACRSVAAAIALFVGDERIQTYEPPRVLSSIGRFAVEPLISAFRGGNFQVRNGVFRCLLATGLSGLELLTIGLQDEDANVRVLVANVLAGIKSNRAIKPLLLALSDQNGDVQIVASIALSQHGPGAIRSLGALLDLNCVRSRLAAVKTLGRFKDLTVIPPLVRSLQDADQDVRWEAAKKLGESNGFQALGLSRKRFLHFCRRVSMNRRSRRIFKTLFRSRSRALEILEPLLSSPDTSDREFGAFALGKVGGVKAVSLLSVTLRDKDAEVRYKAMSALDAIYQRTGAFAGKLGHLVAALGDESSFVSCRAASLLGRMGSHLERPLIMALESKNANIRINALTILMNSVLSVSKAFFLMLRILETEGGQLKAEAISLWTRYGIGVMAPLIIALRDRDDGIRAAAVDALRGINDQRSAEALILALNDSSPTVRCLAAYGLAKTKGERTVISLIGSLSDPNPEVRWFAADALCQVRDRQALPELRRLAKEDHTETRFGTVARAAHNAVNRILVS